MSLRRLLAALAVVLATLGALASPASAHALLLRSEPGGNATLKTSPAAVRLHYSEPVEVQFGAVRVLNADGRPVPTGAIKRVDENREVDVPLRRLDDGTYTVTWQVLANDGHPTHGTFRFYVGQPSSISALAVAGPRGASRAIGWLFGVVRFAWFASFLSLVGAVAARLWVWTPAAAEVDAAEGVRTGFLRRFRRLMGAAWLTLLISGLLSIWFEAATVSGLSFVESGKPSVLTQVLRTRFGQAWLLQIGFTVVALAVVVALTRRPRLFGIATRQWLVAGAVIAVGLAGAAALNGHARTDPHPWLSETLVALHLLSAAAWAGGLAALVVLGGPAWWTLDRSKRDKTKPARAALLRAAVMRFSRLAVIAVSVLVVSGTVVAFWDVATIRGLVDTSYGRTLTAKVILLVVALVLAYRHLRRTPVRLAGKEAAGELTAFARTSGAETVVLAATVALAAALVALTPGRSLQSVNSGLLDASHRAGPYTIELTVDPRAVGPNEIHVTFTNDSGLLAEDVAKATAVLRPARGPVVPIPLTVFTAGHFVGDVTIPATGRYHLDVSGNGSGSSFSFSVAGSQTASP